MKMYDWSKNLLTNLWCFLHAFVFISIAGEYIKKPFKYIMEASYSFSNVKFYVSIYKQRKNI